VFLHPRKLQIKLQHFHRKRKVPENSWLRITYSNLCLICAIASCDEKETPLGTVCDAFLFRLAGRPFSSLSFLNAPYLLVASATKVASQLPLSKVIYKHRDIRPSTRRTGRYIRQSSVARCVSQETLFHARKYRTGREIRQDNHRLRCVGSYD